MSLKKEQPDVENPENIDVSALPAWQRFFINYGEKVQEAGPILTGLDPGPDMIEAIKDTLKQGKK